MKKTLLVLALAAVLVFTLTTVASAKYGSYLGVDVNHAYLSWGGANAINVAITGGPTQSDSPHGGYTATTVKCVVCHSTHRATSDATFTTKTAADPFGAADGYKIGNVTSAGTDTSLLNGAGGSCVQCHAAFGASPSAALVEIGQTFSGPHIGVAGATCTSRGCHGSIHGSGTPSKYAVAVKYNLTNGTSGLLDTQMDDAIASGNVATVPAYIPGAVQEINTTNTGQAMKAYVTGYVCFPCHGNSSFSVAKRGAANVITYNGVQAAKTGHPSTGMSTTKWVPTCEACHDMVGVATNSTAFPHANRGIDVYKGRFDNYTQSVVTGAVIATDNTVATQYGLWMTSADYHDNVNATPIVDKQNGYSLQDGSCIKCHNPAGLK